MEIKDVKIEEFNQLRKKNKNIFLIFKTPWCGVCKVNMPVIEKEIKNIDRKDILFLTVDADEAKVWEDETNDEFKIKIVPTFYLFINGIQKWTHSNFLSDKELRTVINSVPAS